MPILPPEPALYPENLFTAQTELGQGPRAWWVLHARPRQEKSLARYLHEKAIPFYLPLIRRRWRMRGRVMNSLLPLFGGYLFLLADRDERIAALASQRIAHTLQVGDQARLWHDLSQVQRLIATGAPVTPEQRLAPGMPVEIREGPLAGLQGKILRAASGRRFVVQVDFIQQGASVLLDDFSLVPIREQACV